MKNLQNNPKVIQLRNFGDAGKPIPIEEIKRDVKEAQEMMALMSGCVTEEQEDKCMGYIEREFENPTVRRRGQEYLDRIVEIAKGER